jgi:hypothetical protein
MLSMNPRCLGSVLLGGLAVTSVLGASSHPAAPVSAKATNGARPSRLNLPLSFEANQGQTDSKVRFMARGGGFDVFFTPEEAVLRLKSGGKQGKQLPSEFQKKETSRQAAVVRMKLVGANRTAKVSGGRKLPGESNYLRGKDRSRWIQHVSHFAEVRYDDVYPGVDAVYYGNDHKLEYDLVVAPGADPGQIRLSLAGAEKVRVDDAGDLVLSTAVGELRQHRPVVYQEVDGARKPVDGRYTLQASATPGVDPVVGFELGKYDRSQPLVIDPVLAWATFLGGSYNDEGNGIDVDQDGFVYVAGTTESPDFPVTSGAVQVELNGLTDAFVTKMTNDGSTLVYSSFLGGSGEEDGFGISVHASGRAFVTGRTNSIDFPIAFPPKSEAAQPVYGGGAWDIFISALSADGSELFYSTYLGGYIPEKPGKVNSSEIAYGIAVDEPGNAYVTGSTDSDWFPTLRAIQPHFGGGTLDAVVVKLNVLGELDFSTYMGGGPLNYQGGTDFGKGVDVGYTVAVDPGGFVYVAGCTSSKNFPTYVNFQRVNRSIRSADPDAWVAKFIPGGKQLQYCSYLGGNSTDCALGIAADAEGNAYVTGVTRSNNLTTTNPIHGSARGANDIFLAKINSAGFQLMCCTYLGGSDNDEGHDIAVDLAGNIFIVGATTSVDFPVTRPMQARFGGLYDTFVMKIAPTCRTILYSGYFGSNDQDYGNGIALDDEGNAYVVGTAYQNTFPTTTGVVQPTYGGGDSDAFVAKIIDDEEVEAGGKIKVIKRMRFGKCPVSATTTKTFIIKNVGKETLAGTVHALPVGPFRVDSNGGAFALAKGKSITVRVLCRPDARETLRETLYIESSDPNKPVCIIYLEATGV